jgi:hypothetical protein
MVIVPFVFVFVFLAAEVLLISAATLLGTLNFFTSISNFITLGNPLTKHENNIPISSDISPDYNQKLTTILLNRNKVLIIPFKWYYHINIISGTPRFFGIHDYITYGISIGSILVPKKQHK